MLQKQKEQEEKLAKMKEEEKMNASSPKKSQKKSVIDTNLVKSIQSKDSKFGEAFAKVMHEKMIDTQEAAYRRIEEEQ